MSAMLRGRSKALLTIKWPPCLRRVACIQSVDTAFLVAATLTPNVYSNSRSSTLLPRLPRVASSFLQPAEFHLWLSLSM